MNKLYSNFGDLFFCMGLIFVWILIVHANILFLEVGSIELIVVCTILCIVQFLTIWALANKMHFYSFSALHLFLLSEIVFFVFMPFLAAVFNYHFVVTDMSQGGVTYLLTLNFWLVFLYFFTYRAVVGKTQLGFSMALNTLSRKEKHILFGCALLAIIIGLAGFIGIYIKIGGVIGVDYVQLGLSLRGDSWILRLGELLAIGGLIITLIGKVTKNNQLFWIGLLIVVAYAFLRMPFQNRENALKYFVVLFIMLQFLAYRTVPSSKIFSWFLFGVGVAITLPFLSFIRSGWEVEVASEIYKFFLFRDLNFSEIPSELLANERYSGAIGLQDGFMKSFGMLVPRQLWPDKPFPVAINITEWVTPVKNYDSANTSFAYAPTYIGFGYAVGGELFVFLSVFFVALATGMFVRRVRYSMVRYNFVDIIIAALVVYYGTVAFHKLDPGNILTGIVLPITFLVFVKYFILIARKTHMESNKL